MTTETFDPNEHLIDFRGRKYLEVKWRLQWLRSEFPKINVSTTLEHFSDEFALFRAEVQCMDNEGTLVKQATGHAKEYRGVFADFVEKAETKAIGRALAALGYGWLEDDDDDETDGQRNAREYREGKRNAPAPPKRMLASEAQIKAILKLGEQCGFNEEAIEVEVLELYGTGFRDLDRRSASRFIDHLSEIVRAK